MKLRPYTEDDAHALADVYRAAVLVTGRRGYSPLQVKAWASFRDDREGFRDRLGQGVTLLAEGSGTILGFGQLHPADRIALLFTSPDHGRRGVASTILAALEALAVEAGETRLRTEASVVARPFFLKLGFTVDEEEVVDYGGVLFTRFRMSKNLAG
jgi:putative acetyltransferase